jgi:spore coat polysaccharide biosynthesis protein SpsF
MTRGSVGVVLQARMGSRRLPGKVLVRIGGRTILGHCLQRLMASGVGPVIVATTTGPEDDRVEEEATAIGAGVVRGFREDVLQRFMLAAARLDVEYLIRATADNPGVDIDAPARTLRALIDQHADHAVEAGLPIGGAVEAVRVDALREAASRSTCAYDREHVTPYLRQRPDEFRVVAPDAPIEVMRPDLRFTIDTPEDLMYMRAVMTHAGSGKRMVTLQELIRAADSLSLREKAA